MYEHLWENELLDWDLSGFEGKKIKPETVFDLVLSPDPKKVESAYWRIEDVAYRNGCAYSISITLTKAILALLPSASSVGRDFSLEILSLIHAGEPSIEQSALTRSVRDMCIYELHKATYYLYNGLQFSDDNKIHLYVDLLVLISYDYKDDRDIILLYLDQALKYKKSNEWSLLLTNAIHAIKSFP